MNFDTFYRAWFAMRDQLTPEGQAYFDERYYPRALVPMHIFVFSLFLGWLGVDRFILGHWGRGLGKLLTCGGFGIWMIVDWFLVAGDTRRRNTGIAEDLISTMRTIEDASVSREAGQ